MGAGVTSGPQSSSGEKIGYNHQFHVVHVYESGGVKPTNSRSALKGGAVGYKR